jgi:hypothetical protein
MAEQRPQERRHRALKELRRFRREQASSHGSGHERFRVRAVVGGLLLMFFAYTYAVWTERWYSEGCGLVAGLGFWITLLGIFSPIAYPILKASGDLIVLILQIPSVLFLQTRMHLLDLILMVALLGNGIGLIFEQTQDQEAAFTLVLCVLWCILVLGGAAWGLWVCMALRIENALTRGSMILAGVLFPATVPGIILAPLLLIESVQSFSGHPWCSLLLIACVPIVIIGALGVMEGAYLYHFKAWDAMQAKRLQQGRAKQQPA